MQQSHFHVIHFCFHVPTATLNRSCCDHMAPNATDFYIWNFSKKLCCPLPVVACLCILDLSSIFEIQYYMHSWKLWLCFCLLLFLGIYQIPLLQSHVSFPICLRFLIFLLLPDLSVLWVFGLLVFSPLRIYSFLALKDCFYFMSRDFNFTL